MTTDLNDRTTDHRRITTSPIVPTKRALPRWLAPLGITAFAFVAGIGGLVADANNHPPPSPTDSPNQYGTSQRVIQESIDVAIRRTRPQRLDTVEADGSQAGQEMVGHLPVDVVGFEACANAVGDGTVQRPIQDTIAVAPAEGDVGRTFGTGRLRQPGPADGPGTQYVTTAAGVRVPLDEVIADLEANSENHLPVPTPVPLDEVIADLEANSENHLPVPTPVSLDEVIADLEANSENHLPTRNASPSAPVANQMSRGGEIRTPGLLLPKQAR